MSFLRGLGTSSLKLSQLPQTPSINTSFKRFRKPSPCDVCFPSQEKRPCFDPNKVVFDRGNQCHAKLVKSFLYSQYWPREPSVCGLWMNLNSSYLDVLSERYSQQGDRFIAFERVERTNELKVIGLAVAHKVYPWMINEMEEWAHYTTCMPERNRMFFIAHCQKSPNLFKKYDVDYFYEVQVLGTAAEVTGQGVATRLLSNVLAHAKDTRHEIVMINCLSEYSKKCAKRCGMKKEWSMDYCDYVDEAGQKVFFPRRPHLTVSVYSKRFDPSLGGRYPCEKQYHEDVKVHIPPVRIFYCWVVEIFTPVCNERHEIVRRDTTEHCKGRYTILLTHYTILLTTDDSNLIEKRKLCKDDSKQYKQAEEQKDITGERKTCVQALLMLTKKK